MQSAECNSIAPAERCARLFALAGFAAAFFGAACHEECADKEADTEEAVVHIAGRRMLGLGQDGRKVQCGILAIVHTHHDQKSQDGDDKNGFGEQFKIHVFFWCAKDKQVRPQGQFQSL